MTQQNLESTLQATKKSAKIIANLSESTRQKALETMAEHIQAQSEIICEANAKDIAKAKASNLPKALQNRLSLNAKKVQLMADSIRQIAALPSPLGKVLARFTRPSGIEIEKLSVPLGVIGVIYESRPNVTSDVSALCFKSGNASVLKGGKEAHFSNRAILEALHTALQKCDLPTESITMIDESEVVKVFVKMDKYVDLLIPRGGEGLIQFVKEHSTIPIIKHDKGVCHIFVEKTANREKARKIILNAKLSYPAACNACECVLLDKNLGENDIKNIIQSLHSHGVRVMFENDNALKKYGAENDALADFSREYGEAVINLKIVGGIDEALEHIAHYGSSHSDAIITEDSTLGERFLREVDSACVYVNASTRFSDGGEFGFGAEVGISTSKLHARGPMGIDTLCSYKYCIRANGAIRE